MNLLVAMRVLGDRAITSASGSGFPGRFLFFLTGLDLGLGFVLFCSGLYYFVLDEQTLLLKQVKKTHHQTSFSPKTDSYEN